jgi:hypothetical protein
VTSSQAKFSPLFARQQPGGVLTVAGIDETPGDVWFVDSAATGAGATTGHGRSPHSPFATLAYAFSSDLVGSGDVVYVMPGHAETVNAAGDITMDIAGVRVVGLGSGAARPTFTWATDTAATWLITAASVTVENVLCTTTGTIDVVAGIVVTGADVTLVDVEVREGSATSQFVDAIGIGTGGARCKLIRPKVMGALAGDASQSAIQVTAAVSEVVIVEPWVVGTYAAGCIETTAANLQMLIKNSVTRNAHATQDGGIVLNSGTTGQVVNPVTQSATNDADGFNLAFVGAAVAWFNPLVVNLAGERGGSSLTASAAA